MRAARAALARRLADVEVRVGEHRDLRQVRDAEHLVVPADVADLAADHLGDGAAHAGVDLVEDVEARRARARRARA